MLKKLILMAALVASVVGAVAEPYVSSVEGNRYSSTNYQLRVYGYNLAGSTCGGSYVVLETWNGSGWSAYDFVNINSWGPVGDVNSLAVSYGIPAGYLFRVQVADSYCPSPNWSVWYIDMRTGLGPFSGYQ